MNKLKKALIKFTNSNPTLFANNNNNENSQTLIRQQFSQFFNVNTTNFRTPNHPPYAAMIQKAILELNEKGGSSEESISKYIKKEYVDLPWAHSSLLKHHLEKLCDREEISLTRKQRYCLAGAESVSISGPESDNQLKRKRNSESGKKSDDHRKKNKKLKSEPDSESGKARSKDCKKLKCRPNSESGKESSKYRKKKKKSLLDIQETNKKTIIIFQEQDVEPLNKVADEQENITDNRMHEPQYLGTEDQSVEQPTDKELTGICENNKGEMKRKRRAKKRKLMYSSSKEIYKRSKRRKEAQLQVGKANLKQHNEVTDNESHEQNQIIEVNTCDIQFQEENEVGTCVAKEVFKNDTQSQELSEKQHNEVTDNESLEQNRIIEVNTCDTQFQEENEVGTSVTKVYKNDNSAKRVWTRSQLMAMSKNDGIASSKLTAIPNHTPNDKLDALENLYEEKQSSMEIIKAKLRSSQKNTNVEEPTTATTSELTVSQDYTNMPKDKDDDGEYLSEEKELSCEIIEVKEAKQTPSQASSQVNRQRAKLRSSQKNTDLDEQTTTPITTEAHEASDSHQYQQPEDSEDPPEENKPKYKGCGSPPKLKDPETNEVSSETRSPANSVKSKLSAKMDKIEGKRPTTSLCEDDVSDKAKPTNKKSQLNCIRHKMTRSAKMRDPICYARVKPKSVRVDTC